ncbi:hypothetical protein HanRHA438_Chr04g0176671 [Helianthus annuus]|nr:hypothetical protein HanRHA438_Chr04g0176671 [Helianthus annuus]
MFFVEEVEPKSRIRKNHIRNTTYRNKKNRSLICVSPSDLFQTFHPFDFESPD